MFSSHIRKVQLAAALILLGAVGLSASDEKKPSIPLPKSATAHVKLPGHTIAPAVPAKGKTGGAEPAAHAGQPAGSAHSAHAANGTAPHTTSTPSNRPATGGPGVNHPGGPGNANMVRPGGPNGLHQPGPPRPGAPGLNPMVRPARFGISGRPVPRGSRVQRLNNGSALQRRPDGRVSDVHDGNRGMDIHHSLNGGRQVTVVRPDHSRIVVERGRPGFVERPYVYRGHDFAQRSYYYHGHMYHSYYRGYMYRGVPIRVYAPVRYYPVGFYGWAYHPWGVPVIFSWGWGGAPWYGYYGFYFSPYRTYPDAAFWLTDYMISSELAAAYEAGRASAQTAPAQPAGNNSPALTPEVKQQIADEVRNQIVLENAEAEQTAANQDVDPASSGIARMLSDGHAHIFVADGDLDVVDAFGAECSLSDGDVLQLITPPPPIAPSARLMVLASKGGNECAKSSTVRVTVADLQEMQNHMRETIDRGMDELKQKQGHDGLPAAPPSAAAAPTTAPFATLAPPPDPNDTNAINQQEKAADQVEQDVTRQAEQAPPPAN